MWSVALAILFTSIPVGTSLVRVPQAGWSAPAILDFPRRIPTTVTCGEDCGLSQACPVCQSALAGRLRKHDFISVPPHTSCTVGPGCPSYYALMAPSASTRHRVPRLDSTTPGPALRRRFFFLILIIKPPCWPTGNNSASLNATLVIQPLGFFSFLQHVVQFPCLGLSFLSF